MLYHPVRAWLERACHIGSRLPAAVWLCWFSDADLRCRYVVAVTVRGLVGWACDPRWQDDGRLDLRCLRTSGRTGRCEAELTAHLQAAGIRLPASVPGPGGCFVARLPAVPAAAGCGYRWIDGVPADLTGTSAAARVGSLLGRLHACALPPRGQADPWYDTVPDPAAWDQLADSALAHRAPWAAPLAERISLLRELSAVVTPQAGEPLITCHRDLHPDNVLADGPGELVLPD